MLLHSRIARRWLSSSQSQPVVATSHAKGLFFEQYVLDYLKTMDFDVRRTGGAADGGIDFRGHWRLSSLPEAVPVVGQCKNEVRKSGAQYIREFEGVLLRENGAIGIIATTAGFSGLALERFKSSSLPMILATIKTDSIDSLQMNSAAGIRLPFVQIGSKLVRLADGFKRVPVIISVNMDSKT